MPRNIAQFGYYFRRGNTLASVSWHYCVHHESISWPYTSTFVTLQSGALPDRPVFVTKKQKNELIIGERTTTTIHQHHHATEGKIIAHSTSTVHCVKKKKIQELFPHCPKMKRAAQHSYSTSRYVLILLFCSNDATQMLYAAASSTAAITLFARASRCLSTWSRTTLLCAQPQLAHEQPTYTDRLTEERLDMMQNRGKSNHTTALFVLWRAWRWHLHLLKWNKGETSVFIK